MCETRGVTRMGTLFEGKDLFLKHLSRTALLSRIFMCNNKKGKS